MVPGSSTPPKLRRLRLLGEGGAGRVWLAEDPGRPGRLFALKELVETNRDREEELRGEFATLATLRHPNLVRVHEFEISPESGRAEFTLEFVDGLDLVTAARDGGPALLLDLAAECLRALSFLHDFGLLHRDLKPANLLVRHEPRSGCKLVVLDFGLALQGRAPEGSRPGLAGTLPYMAPELFAGGESSRKTDLYALGAVLYEAVHGKPPHEPDPDDLAGFIDRVRSGRRSRPGLPDGYPEGLAGWLEHLLFPDPSDRPSGASEALARLNATCGTDYEIETRATRMARLASGAPPGRDDELRALWSHLSADGKPNVIWLAGDAGSGKSRILRWLSSEAVRQGWEVHTDGPARTALQSKDEGDSEKDGFLNALRRRAGGGPVAIMLDEMESADSALVEQVARLSREDPGGGLKLLAAVRPAEAANPELRQLLRDADLFPSVARIDLQPLSDHAIRQVVERATGGGEALPQRVQWLVEASEGNALVLEALIVEESWEKGSKTARHRTLEESIAGRLEQLSPGGKVWLQALVVLGNRAHVAWVNALSGLDGAEARRASEELRGSGLAGEQQGFWSPFSKILVEYLLRSLDPEETRLLHARAAEAIDESESGPAQAGRLARLWAAAKNRKEARRCALEAADHAGRAGQRAEEADWLRLALLQLERRDPERRPLRLRHADALIASNQGLPAYRALATCLRLAGSDAERAELLARQSRTLISLARYRKALDVGRGARALAGSVGETAIAARCAGVMGEAMYSLALFEEAIPVLLEGAKEHESANNALGHAECIYMVGICESRLRHFDSARSCFASVLEFATANENDRIRVNSLISLGNLEGRQWRCSQALDYLEQARTIAAQSDDLKRQHASILASLGNILPYTGQLGRALETAREGAAIATNMGSRGWLLSCRLSEANTLVLAGRPAEAAARLEETLKQMGDIEVDFKGFVKITLVEALLESPEPDDARIGELLAEVMADAGEQKKQILGALLLEMERRVLPGCLEPFEPIRIEYDEKLERHGESFEPPYQSRAELAKIRHLIDAGMLADAEQVAVAAAASQEKKELPDHAARTHALLAEIREKAGRFAEADRSMATGRKLLDAAAERIDDQVMRRDFLDRPVFRALRNAESRGSVRGEKRLLAIYEMIRALNSETDPESILESTLDMALRVVRAERGMILQRGEGGEYRVRVARNLEKETIEDASEFSRNVVLEAEKGKAVLAVDTGEDERLRELKSVSLYGIRSVLCVPLRSRGKIIGAVYLDNRSDATLFSPDDLRFLEAFADNAALALENAQIRRELELENQRLQRAAESRVQFGNIVGRSEPMQRLYDLIHKVSDNKLPVLIQGESGTGKELVARAIHFNGPRRKLPFVSENCAAIPETLLESELFGHVKGAFTGAERDRAGLFEQAHNGTLMLDEVGDMSPAMQARLLRALQEGEVRRVGGERWFKVDVRVIAATHRDLNEEVKANRFREDLLYRLQVLVIPLPPLRDRPGDLPLLVDHFLQKIARERDRARPVLRSPVMDLLERYHWPGNIRQLENVLQRLTLLAGEAPVTVGVVESDRELRRTLVGESDDSAPIYSLERSEEQKIREALRAASGNRTRAAKLLGISRATIFRKIKQYGLS